MRHKCVQPMVASGNLLVESLSIREKLHTQDFTAYLFVIELQALFWTQESRGEPSSRILDCDRPLGSEEEAE